MVITAMQIKNESVGEMQTKWDRAGKIEYIIIDGITGIRKIK